MKIALLNAFPNLLHSAEREFIERCIAVLGALGHEARSVVTSDDIIALDPDLVIVTHEFVAKTTDHFTVGLLWSPTQFYRDEEERVKAIRSWDLVVPINAATRRFARDMHFPLRHDTAVSELDFYPSAPATALALPDASKLSLVYVGAHWDGQRHRRIFEEIAKLTEFHVYGPAKAWDFMPGNYRGSIPFDGQSLLSTINRHGIVLALHKAEHVEEETPSMRVFEACSARCAVITERMQPLVDVFGDSIDYIETTTSPRRLAQNVAAIVQRYRADPALFEQTVARAQQAFVARASLERLLAGLLDDVAARKPKALAASVPAAQEMEVSIIVRCGSRPLAVLQRTVASLAAQTYSRIGLILVRFAEIDGFDDWLRELRAAGRFTFVNEVAAPGNGVRSAAMWAGLRAVQSEAFGLLDDDDELFRDHIAGVAAVLRSDPGCDVAYSGVVKQEEDGVFLNEHVRFKGDRQAEIPERRALKFMDDFDLDRLLRFDNFIQSNTWLARKRVLTPEVLDDPALEVGEDMYFYLLLASRHRFQFSGRVSAVWNWRSKAGDNSMTAVSQEQWVRCGQIVIRRLAGLQFPGAFSGRTVLGLGRPAFAPHPASAPRPPAQGGVAAAPAVAAVAPGLKGWVGGIVRHAVARRSARRAAEPPPFDPGDIACSLDFTAPSLPPDLIDAHGLSASEGWGRWTEGPSLTLRFRRPLPARFTLHLIGHAFKSNHDLPITVCAGQSAATFRMSMWNRMGRYAVPLVNSDSAASLVFRIPNPRSPASLDSRSSDPRLLGIGLVRLDIVEG